MSDSYRVGFALRAIGNVEDLPKPPDIVGSYVDEIAKILKSFVSVKISFHSAEMQWCLNTTTAHGLRKSLREFYDDEFLREYYGERAVRCVNDNNMTDQKVYLISFMALAHEVSNQSKLELALPQVEEEINLFFSTISVMDIKVVSCAARLLKSDKYFITFSSFLTGRLNNKENLYEDRKVEEIESSVARILESRTDINICLVSLYITQQKDNLLCSSDYKNTVKYQNQIECMNTENIEDRYIYKFYALVTGIQNETHLLVSLSKIADQMSTDLNTVGDIEIHLNSYGYKVLLDDTNLGVCVNCGGWVTDYDHPNLVRGGFQDGAYYEGEWYCEFCLPSHHPKYVRLPD